MSTPEGMRDLLGDAYTAEPGVAALQRNDRRDEFCRGTFGAGFAATVDGGKEQTIFPIHQGFVELEQRCRLDERAKLRNPARAHEQRGQSEHEAIERGQIRGALSRAITDQDLVLEQQRLRSDGTYATWPEEFHKGDQQVDSEHEEVAHGVNRIMTTSARKTAPHGRIPSYYEFAPHRSITVESRLTSLFLNRNVRRPCARG